MRQARLRKALGACGALVLVLLLARAATAGEPVVTLEPRSFILEYLMYPEFYRTLEDARVDTTWPSPERDAAAAYWDQQGRVLLKLVSELSGVKWQEKAFPLYLVEEAPAWGTWDPLVLPVSQWRRGDLVRVAPRGHAFGFVCAHHLAQRLFAQVERGKEPKAFAHPLFQPGLGTRDNMANLVAYWTMVEVAGEEQAVRLLADTGLLSESPGIRLVAERFLPGWRLSKARPLVRWVEEEPVDSDLVKAMLSLRDSLGVPVEGRRPGPVERSRIGLRVRPNADGDAVVVALEAGKLAEMADLRPGDILARVGQVTVTNSRDVMTRIIAQLRATRQVEILVERDGELEPHYMNMAWLEKRER